MVQTKSRVAVMIVIFSILPFVALATPVAASHEDECAGGVDASSKTSSPTELQVYGGCTGQLYNSPGDSNKHAEDFIDSYKIRAEGSGTAYLEWRLCNEAKVGILFFEVYWHGDVLKGYRKDGGGLDVGQCTSVDPVMLSGEYKPGEWHIYIHTIEEYLPENKVLNYNIYAQPISKD